MKLTQKDKMMLILLCIVMMAAGVYILVIQPMSDTKLELETTLAEKKGVWDEKADPVINSFTGGEYNAERYWKMSPTTLTTSMNNMLYDGTYSLGNRITDRMGEAKSLAETTNVLPQQPSYSLSGYIIDNFLTDYVSFSEYGMTPIILTEYTMGEVVEGGTPIIYSIASCTVSITNFNCNVDVNNFYDMINKMEKSGYILINNLSFLTSTREGSIEFTVFMTPGDLSDYEVMQGPSGRFILSDSIKDKYNNAPIVAPTE